MLWPPYVAVTTSDYLNSPWQCVWIQRALAELVQGSCDSGERLNQYASGNILSDAHHEALTRSSLT